jgi:gliding motility-associated-like protein
MRKNIYQINFLQNNYNKCFIACLLMFLPYYSIGQCVNQGTINSPACGATNTQANVGGRQSWTMNTVNGALYEVTINNAIYTPSPATFTGTGGTQTVNILWNLGCNFNSTSATLTYRRLAPTNTTSIANICGNGTSRALTATPAGGTWTHSGAGSISGTTYTSAGSGAATVTYTLGGCPAAATFTVHAPPTAPTNITGTSTICVGASTTLTAAGGTEGFGATYQWYAGGCGSGAVLGTGISLNVSPTTNTTYFVRRVASVANSCTNTTLCASVTVNVNQLSGVGAVSANQTICSGNQPSNMTIASSNGTVQWQRAENAAFTVGITNVGTNSNTLTSAQAGALTATRYFRAIVTNGVCPPIVSNIITVNVDPTNFVGAVSANQTICSGSSPANITIASASGTVQWQQANDAAFTVGITNVGSNSNTLTSAQIGNLTATRYFRATVSAGVCPSVNSNIVTVTVSPTSAVGAVSANQNICSGSEPANITLASSTGTVQWQRAENAAFTTGVTNIGGNSNTLTGAQIGTLTATRYFRAIVTSGVCPPITSGVVTVNVSPTSAVGSVSANQTICSGSSPSNITISSSTGTVQWQQANDLAFTTGIINVGTNSNTLTSVQIGTLTATRYYRATVTSGACPPISSNVVTVNVSPTTNAGSISAVATNICAGSIAQLSISGSVGTIQWQEEINSVWTNISGATNTTYNSLPLTNSRSYRAVVQSGVCPSMISNVVNINVDPAPSAGAIVAADNNLCQGQGTQLEIFGSSGTIQWQVDVNGTFQDITGANFNTYNTPLLTQTTFYRAKISSGVCTELFTNIVTIVVDPNTNAGTLSSNATSICENNVVALTLTGSVGAIQWQENSSGSWQNITGATGNTYNSSPLLNTVSFRINAISGVCPLVISDSIEISVIPTPIAGTASASVSNICQGQNSTLTLSGSNGNIQWQRLDGSNWVDITGATNATFTTPNLTTTTTYRASSNSGVCPTVFSNSVTINVDVTAVAGTVTSPNTNLCVDDVATLNVSGQIGNIQWQTDESGSWQDIVGATGSLYNSTLLIADVSFRVVITNGVCSSVISNEVLINVTPSSIAGNITASNDTICSGSTSTLTLSGSLGTIQWQNNIGGVWTNITGATNNTFTTPILSSDQSYRVVVTNGVCSPIISLPITIVVNQPSIAGVVSAIIPNICSGNVSQLALTGSFGNIQWQTNASGTFTDIPNANLNNYITPVLTNNTSYRAVVTNGVCPSIITNSVAINVEPQPVAPVVTRIPNDTNICTSQTVAITSLGGIGGVLGVDEYQYSTNAGSVWLNYTPGDTISTFGLNGINIVQIRARRTSAQNGCNNSPYEVETWSVFPQPVAQDIVPSTNNATVCEGALISTTFINGSGGTGIVEDEYEFTVNSGANWFPYFPGNNILTFGSVGTNTVRVRTRRTATGLSCNTSPWNEVSWSVNAQPVAQNIVRSPLDNEVCQGQIISASFTGGSGGAGSNVTNEYQYSIDGGNSWANYSPSSNLSTALILGNNIIQIRTRRVADGFSCNNTPWNTETWTVVPQTSPQDIVPSTTDAVLCEGAIVSATFTNGSGGTGTISDEYQFSVNAGVTWNTYIPGDNITTAGSVGTNSIKVRTRRLATGSSCAASAWNEYSWSIIAQPIAQNINRLPADPAICEGQNIAATFSGGSGGTGTIVNEYEFSTDFGATWSPYTPSSNISSTGILGIDVIQIRTRRTADGFACNASAYVVQRWTVVAQPIAQDIVRLPIDTNVCTGEIISATFINGSGGAGNITNEYQFTDGGAWQTYIPGNPIASAGITGNNAIGIRTRRIADATGCNATAWEEEYWNIIPQPISQDIVPSVTDAVLCEGAIVSATFINGSGGTGIITDEYEVSTDAGTTWTTYTPGDDILTIGSVGTNTIRVRTRRVASGLSCATSPWNVYNWSIIAQPIAQTITRNPIDTAVCAGQIVSATFNGGSGGTGSTLVNQYEYSVDGGLNWGLYLANAGVSTAGLLGNDILHIRTRRVADGFACNNSPYNVETWTVEPQPVAQDIVRLPLDNIVCEGQDIAANFINGLGGAGVVSDEYQFSTDFGNTWTAYIPNDLISSIGLIGTDIIQIRTRKAATAAGCITTPWNTEKWSVVPQPTPPSFNPNVTPGLICAGTDISASFNVGAGGTGTIIEQFQFTIDGGITWNTYVENSIINTSAIAGTGILVIRGRRIASGLACDTSVWNQVVWNVAPLPFNPIVPNGQVCGTGTVTFSETTGTNEVVDWSYDTNTIIITNNTFTTPTMVGPDTINFFVRRRNTATNCISDWMPVQAVAIEQVVDPVIAHQIICGDNPVTYASTPLANHVTDWSTDANTVFLTNNDYTTPLINAPANDTIFVRYRDTISTCFSDWTIATAELFVIPVPPTIPDEIICGNGSVIINTLPPSIYTVEWALDTLGSITAGNTFTTPSLTAPDTLPVYVRYIEAVSLCQGPWSDLNAIASLLLQAGTIGEDTTICEDQFPHAFDNIVSAVSTAPAGGVVSYTWQYQELCQGAWINIPNSDTTAYTENTPFQADRCYRRLATNNCGTDSSNVVRVNINLLPFVQFVGLLGEYCTDDSSSNFLYGLPLGGTFFGNGLNVNYFEPSTAPLGINTITYEYTDNNGCTNSMTDTTIIHPLPVVTIVSFNQGYCEDLNQPIPLSGTPANGIFTGVGVVGNDFVPALSQVGIQTITYSYTDTTGCDNSASTTVEVFPLPQPLLVGLFDTTCTSSPFIEISVSPAGGILTGNGISNDTINPILLNAGYEVYSYTFMDNNGCIDTYTDSMWVQIGTFVYANPDTIIAIGGELSTINLTANDTGNWSYFEIIDRTYKGVLRNDEFGNIEYTPLESYYGLDSLIYLICDEFCNDCDTTKVYFEVLRRQMQIPSGFSPDGDGINDFFVIEDLMERHPNNEIIIVNRWGDLVYEAKPYQNDWDGTTGNLKLKITGNKVSNGTYFYVLKLGDGTEPIRGYIELKR